MKELKKILLENYNKKATIKCNSITFEECDNGKMQIECEDIYGNEFHCYYTKDACTGRIVNEFMTAFKKMRSSICCDTYCDKIHCCSCCMCENCN